MNTDTITRLPIDELHESPTNPRKRFDDADLQELATDIRAHLAEGGVLQPLLVRPRIPELFRDLPDAAEVAATGYEIVFGHRRYRAAVLAGLERVPCMVRSLTDDEVRRAQISENLQRKDVHPIEEAEGFEALIAAKTHTADSIGEEFGKSRSYVYGRLKLLQACPEIRKACLAGEIGSEVALLVARLRTVKLQEKALSAIRQEWRAKLDDGGKASFRAIRDLLNEKFALALKDAIFDTTDATLVPPAGDCPSCPKRSGNAPEFADVAAAEQGRYSRQHEGPDVCTDPDCFEAKKKAHLARIASQLDSEGFPVVNGPAARSAVGVDGKLKGAVYVPIAVLGKRKLSEVRGAAAKAGATMPGHYKIIDQRTGKVVDALRRSELKAAGVELKEPETRSNDYSSNYNSAEAKAKRAVIEAEWKVERLVRLQLLERVRAAIASTERTTFDLQLIAARMVKHCHWNARRELEALWQTPDRDDEEVSGLEKAVGSMAAGDLARLLLDCAIVGLGVGDESQWYQLNEKPEALLRAAAHYGVDVDQIRAEVASTPSTAARAPEDSEAARAKSDHDGAGSLGQPFHPTRGVRPPGEEQKDDAGDAGEEQADDATKATSAGRALATVRYRSDAGNTWSGRGLKPAWVRAHLAAGGSLAEIEQRTAEAI